MTMIFPFWMMLYYAISFGGLLGLYAFVISRETEAHRYKDKSSQFVDVAKTVFFLQAPKKRAKESLQKQKQTARGALELMVMEKDLN